MLRPPARLAVWLSLPVFFTLACNLPQSLGLVPTATPTATPSPAPSPTPTPTPTPLPEVRVEAADQALFNGDWDLALEEYRATLAQATDPALQAAAQLGIARTLLSAGRYGESVAEFSSYLNLYPDLEGAADAYFLRAHAHRFLGQYDASLADFGGYLERRPGRIDAYVHEQAGDVLRLAGQPLVAVERYRLAVAAPRLGSALGLQLKIGRALMEAGDYAGALAQFDTVYQLAGDGSTRATANLLAGNALEALGDVGAAHERYLDSVRNYPDAFDSYTGLIRLVEAGVPVDEFQRGLVDYYAGAYEPAVAALTRAIGAGPSGAAYYFRGLSRRALGDSVGAAGDLRIAVESFPNDPVRAEAWLALGLTQWAYLEQYSAGIETYLGFVQALPSHPSAPDALFAAGRTAERLGELARAAEIWLRLPVEYPGSGLAYQGGFEAGIARFRIPDYGGARAAFEVAHSHAVRSGDRAASLLWIGKSHEASGDLEAAREAWARAAAADPTGYYSVRAEDLLAGREPFDRSGVFDFTVDLLEERRLAEEWMRATFSIQSPDPLSSLDSQLATDVRMIRAEEFVRLGLYAEAKAEMESLRRAYESDAGATYRLLHKLLEMRLYLPAIFSARQILNLAGMDDAATMQAPVYFNHLRFGPYFGELILPEAARYGLDGLFLLSLVRQESLFEGFATSVAAARGLMQVIPSTGESIARQLGWPPEYETEDLYRPVVSVRFGTFYLAAQRDRFDGDLYAALAAYNAGPGNALIWKELAPSDPDLFLEVIRLLETHRYIRTIYEVFTIYSQLYASP